MIPVLCAEEIEKSAWDLLNHALADGNPVKRGQALTALGLIGSTAPHVVDLLEAGLTDKDATVRQTAAVVMGDIGAKQAIPMLKKALDDDSGEVSFAAARSLWLMGDQSGREVFWAVLAGDQKTGPGMIQGQKSTPGSMWMSERRGIARGPSATSASTPQVASNRPSAPPAAASSRLSVSS